ncbi:uncharacterized protein LOC9637161 [Selaginella moellendorffii]|nr:uncharacterized protein LOC9637161 [Selaginella moellendorffii]|eukprot:XP_002989663.2 uncharacterized protein LOC9637161 [Selaginella moellendorffii]
MACIFLHSFVAAASPHQRSAASSDGAHDCVSSSSSSGSSRAAASRRYSLDARIRESRIECSNVVEERQGRSKNGEWRPPVGWPLVPGGTIPILDEDDLDSHKRSLLSYAVEVPPPEQKEKKRRQQQKQGDDYHVNVGYAIRSLRDELPGMFYKPPTFDIYRDDITFRDPLITFSGIANYKLMFWGLRFYGRIFFKAIWIEIQRIWQPRDKVIMVRWTVYGIPRVPWEARGQFDGTSEYKLDSDGLIYEHKVDNLATNTPTKFKAPGVLDLVVGAAQTPTPSYYMERFTWVRYYLVLRGTLVAACLT